MKSGVYQIINKINNKSYIGVTKNFYNRFAQHKFSLLKNKHHSILLQRAVNKYGINNFEIIILCKSPVEYLNKLEQWFLKNIKPEYNIHISSEYTNNYSRKPLTKEHIQNLKNSFTKERRLKISKDVKERLTGKVKSEQCKLNIQLSVAKITPEQVLIIRQKYKEGIKQVVLAKEFNLTKYAINKIIKRITWKNI